MLRLNFNKPADDDIRSDFETVVSARATLM